MKLNYSLAFVSTVAILIVISTSSCQENKVKTIPVLKEVESFTYCAIEMEGSWNQYNDIKDQLKMEVEKQNIPVDGKIISVWRSYPKTTIEKNYKWEVGFRVAKGTVLKKPLVLKSWESMEVYSQFYDGPSDGVTDFFKSYWSWFEDNDLKAIRPLLEIEFPNDEIEEGFSKFEALIVATKKD